MSTATALVGAVALLVLTNLVNNRWAPSWIVLSSAIASAALIAITFRDGGGWADLGIVLATLGAVLLTAAAGSPTVRRLAWGSRGKLIPARA